MAPWKERHDSSAVPVAILESNPLAATRLREILRQSRTVKLLVGARHGTKVTSNPGLPSVVVIDRDTLAQPLDELLHCLHSEAPRAKALVIGRAIPCGDICRLLSQGQRGSSPISKCGAA